MDPSVKVTYHQHQYAFQRYEHSRKFDYYYFLHNNDSYNQKNYDHACLIWLQIELYRVVLSNPDM